MPKNKVSEYSPTASNNTDIGGINIAEGCAPSGINNAIRELMAQLKDMQSGTDGDAFTIGGGMTCSGAAVFSSTVAVTGVATFNGNATMNGNVTMGNASTDTHTLDGTLTGGTNAKILLDDSVTTATAPALAFDGDTNTGIYRPAADTISVATGGAERVRVSDAGMIVNQGFTCSGAAVMSSTVAVSGTATFSSTVALGSSASATTPSVSDDSTKVATTAFVRDIIPTGVIVMWSGSIASIPSGWLICDGTNGTPDLRNRFIVGAGSIYSVAGTGGSADAINVSHTHTITDSGHRHFVAAYTNVQGVPNGYTTNTSSTQVSAGGGGGGFSEAYQLMATSTDATVGRSSSSTTGISINSAGSSATNANLPPYYALAYIMKS